MQVNQSELFSWVPVSALPVPWKELHNVVTMPACFYCGLVHKAPYTSAIKSISYFNLNKGTWIMIHQYMCDPWKDWDASCPYVRRGYEHQHFQQSVVLRAKNAVKKIETLWTFHRRHRAARRIQRACEDWLWRAPTTRDGHYNISTRLLTRAMGDADKLLCLYCGVRLVKSTRCSCWACYKSGKCFYLLQASLK